MGRYDSNNSYGFRCRYMKTPWDNYYIVSWVVDRYYSDSRLRFPRRCSRETDEAGAIRFCKKHEINMPDTKEG